MITKRNKIGLLLLSIILYSISGFSQVTFKGSIKNENNEKVEMYNVLILNKDSSIITGSFFSVPDFNLKCNSCTTNDTFIVKIIALGYENKFINVYAGDTVSELGVINLSIKSQKEITIGSMRKNLKINNNNNLVLDVESSEELSKESSVYSLFKKIPFVVNGEIIGSNNTGIYLEDREISLSMLKALKPEMIKSIEIIQNPGAQYASKYDAVIQIYLKDNSLIKLSNTQVNVCANQGRQFYHNEDVSTYYSDKHNTFYANMGYYNENKNDKSEVEKQYILFDTVDAVSVISGNNMFSKYDEANYSAGYAYKFSKHKIGFDYSGLQEKDNDSSYNVMSYLKPVSDNILSETTKKRYYQNNMNINYLFSPSDTQKITLLLDYHNKINESNSSAVENFDIYNLGKQDYTIYSGLLKYDSKIFSGDFSSGIQYYWLNDNANFDYKSKMYSETVNSTEQETNLSIFTSFSGKISNNINFDVGGRLENFSFKGVLNDNVVSDTNYLLLFPNLSLSYVSKSQMLRFSAGYNRTVTRPQFSQLNPTKSYINNYVIMSGNPFLRPMVSDDYSLFLILLNSQYLFAKYTTYKDLIVYDNFFLTDSIMLFKPVNYNKTLQGVVLGIANVLPLNKKIRLTHTYSYIYYPTPIFDHGEYRKVKPMHYDRIYIEWLMKKFTFAFDFTFHNKAFSDLTICSSDKYYLLSLEIKYKLKSNMTLKLYVNDILNTTNVEYSKSYLNFYEHTKDNPDDTYVSFSFIWNIGFNENKEYNQKSNEEIINRL